MLEYCLKHRQRSLCRRRHHHEGICHSRRALGTSDSVSPSLGISSNVRIRARTWRRCSDNDMARFTASQAVSAYQAADRVRVRQRALNEPQQHPRRFEEQRVDSLEISMVCDSNRFTIRRTALSHGVDSSTARRRSGHAKTDAKEYA